MLVNDFDDERTLEEEEAMESSEDVQNELDELQKEGDMPIEELLSMYGYGDGNQADNTQSSSSEEILSNQDLTLDKDEIARDLLQLEDQNSKEMSVHDLLDSVDTSVSTSRLLRSAVSHHQSESESESNNEDYVPEEDDDWKKMRLATIQVGSDYQAVIPEGLSKYDGAPAYENDDKLLWDPLKVIDVEAEEYLCKSQQPLTNCTQGVHSIPTGSHVRDDEQALYLLLQCGHNIEEALRRRRMQAVPPADTMSLWSEEECRSFENGLRTYGKDFHLIQQNKVRTRSVGELVQFYYLWKKTERHDVFANKTRLEKKKYALHPGTTDYMDRFLDEQENPSPHRDRSSSPNIHSLISGDHKRQHHNRTPPACTSSSEDLHPFQSQLLLDDHLPQKLVDATSTTSEIPGSAVSLLLSTTSVEELTAAATSFVSSQSPVVKNQIEDLTKNLPPAFDCQGLESLAKLAPRDVNSHEVGLVNFASVGETSDRTVCAINNNNNNNNNGIELNHHQNSSLKNYDISHVSSVNSNANNLGNLPQDGVIPSANSAV